MLNYRTYGLLKGVGSDNVGEYPIYADYYGSALPLYSNYYTNTTKKALADSTYVQGIYSLEAGDFNMAAGYTLDDTNTICRIVVNNYSISGNTIDEYNVNGKTISENAAEYNYTDDDGDDMYDVTITTNEPITDLNTVKLGLPEAVDGTQYIVAASAPGTGTVKFSVPEVAQTGKTYYWGFSPDTIFYSTVQNTKFYCSEYFRRYVLGSRTRYSSSKIEYKCIGAETVTKSMIDEADLIYVSTGAVLDQDLVFSASNDISDEVMMEIYDKEVNDHKAVIMDRNCYDPTDNTNVSSLALLLWQENQSFAVEDDYISDFDITTTVAGNVYVYDHHLSDFSSCLSMVDARDNMANGDFNSPYTQVITDEGFAPVKRYISVTNENSTTGQMLSAVTPAVAIQYILINDGKELTITKKSLNVLEIEPVASYLYNPTNAQEEEYKYLDRDSSYAKNRDYFIEHYLGNYYDDKAYYINFRSMTVDEFNGHNEDLVENYDVIYIGDEMGSLYYTKTMKTKAPRDTGAMYSMNRSVNLVNKGLPFYYKENKAQNTYMNGNVYFSLGGYNKISTGPSFKRLHGFLTTDTDGGRYSSRDITMDKLDKLEEYLENGNLILCDSDLMTRLYMTDGSITTDPVINPTAIADPDENVNDKDIGRIDNSSNMYELFEYAIGYRFNKTTGEYENSGPSEGSYTKYPNLVPVGDIEYGNVDKSDVELN